MGKSQTEVSKDFLKQWEKMGEHIKETLGTNPDKQTIQQVIQKSIHEISKLGEAHGLSFHECIYGTRDALDETLNPGMFIITSKSDPRRYHVEHHCTLQ